MKLDNKANPGRGFEARCWNAFLSSSGPSCQRSMPQMFFWVRVVCMIVRPARAAGRP